MSFNILAFDQSATFDIRNRNYYFCIASNLVYPVKIKILWIIQVLSLATYFSGVIYLICIDGKLLKLNMISLILITLSMQILYVLVIGVMEFVIYDRVVNTTRNTGTLQIVTHTQFYFLQQSIIQFFNMIITFCNFTFFYKMRQIEIQIDPTLSIK